MDLRNLGHDSHSQLNIVTLLLFDVIKMRKQDCNVNSSKVTQLIIVELAGFANPKTQVLNEAILW